jgi:hypothetical protein
LEHVESVLQSTPIRFFDVQFDGSREGRCWTCKFSSGILFDGNPVNERENEVIQAGREAVRDASGKAFPTTKYTVVL